MAELDKRPWVVLGMHRSGTSAVSGALNKLGIYFGPEEKFFVADSNNESGYFELEDLTATHHETLQAFQLRPWSVESMPINWRERPLASPIIHDLVQYFSSTFTGKGAWGFKQPMTTLLMPLYAEVFKRLKLQPSYIICVRNPLETLESERNWAFEHKKRLLAPLAERAIGTWLRYTLGALKECPNACTAIVLYDELLRDPEKILHSVVGIQPDRTRTVKDIQNAASHINRSLRHNRSVNEALNQWPKVVGDTYDLAKKGCLLPAELRSGRLDDQIEALWTEFDQWRSMMRPPAPSAGVLALFYQSKQGVKAFEQRFQPEGDWQNVRLEVDAPPQTRLLGSLYNQPCRIWIREVEWICQGHPIKTELVPSPTSAAYDAGTVRAFDVGPTSYQFSLQAPKGEGPYVLRVELLLETSPEISGFVSERVIKMLEHFSRRP
jgi:hypothetical protein